MLNVIIFLLGAGLMFFMALRSMLARRRLCTRGEKVEATVEGIVQSRDGAAYVLAFATAGGSHRLQYPKPAKAKAFAAGSTVTLYYDIDMFQHVNNVSQQMYFDVGKMEFYEKVLGAEVLYAVVGAALLVLTVGIAR